MRNIQVLIAMIAALIAVEIAPYAQADFQLNLSIGPEQQTVPTEVFFDVSIGFQGDPGDYVDTFTLSLSNNTLPLAFDYTRFSWRNLQNNFQGSGPFSNVGVAALTMSAPNTLPTGSVLLLGELVLNTNGLATGSYNVAFNLAETDASGVLGGNVNEFIQDVGGTISSNLRTVNVSAVPEPSGLALVFGLVFGWHWLSAAPPVSRTKGWRISTKPSQLTRTKLSINQDHLLTTSDSPRGNFDNAEAQREGRKTSLRDLCVSAFQNRFTNS